MQEIDLTQYQQHVPNEGLKELFPRLVAMNEYAERFGWCRNANWDNILAHAHPHDGIICVKGPLSNLLEQRRNGLAPTSLFLHEYAHLELPDDWHTPRFAELNEELHKKWGVAHDAKVEAIFTIITSLIIIGVGVGLYVATGWGWFGIGAGIVLLMNLGRAFNSFQEEQIAAHEHDMREWRAAAPADPMESDAPNPEFIYDCPVCGAKAGEACDQRKHISRGVGQE